MLRCGLASLQTLLGDWDWDWGFLKSLIQLRGLESQLYEKREQVSHLYLLQRIGCFNVISLICLLFAPCLRCCHLVTHDASVLHIIYDCIHDTTVLVFALC